MSADAATLDLLAWLAARPRSYEETMDAWRTSCPRLSTWEDAVAAGLVSVHRSEGGATVVLTPAGRVLVEVSPPAA